MAFLIEKLDIKPEMTLTVIIRQMLDEDYLYFNNAGYTMSMNFS